MRNIIYNQQGASLYKKMMMLVVVVAIIVLILLIKRSGEVKEQAAEKTSDFEKRAVEAGVELGEFK